MCWCCVSRVRKSAGQRGVTRNCAYTHSFGPFSFGGLPSTLRTSSPADTWVPGLAQLVIEGPRRGPLSGPPAHREEAVHAVSSVSSGGFTVGWQPQLPPVRFCWVPLACSWRRRPLPSPPRARGRGGFVTGGVPPAKLAWGQARDKLRLGRAEPVRPRSAPLSRLIPIFLPTLFLPNLIGHQAVRLARRLAASSSSRREPRRGTEGCPRIARMGRRRLASHKEHQDRKEGGSRGACISGPMAPVPGFLPPPALCSLRSWWLTLSGLSIPPSIILPPSFCRRPKTSARTRAAPATRAATHPAGRSGWPRNPSTCSPFHAFRPRPPAPPAPCRPPFPPPLPSDLRPPRSTIPPFPLASEKSNGPISPSPARAILPPMCDPCASVPSGLPRPPAGSPAQASTNSLPGAPPPLHPAPRSNRARPSPFPRGDASSEASPLAVGQASRPAGSWGLRPQANLTVFHQIPASKDSSPLSLGPARGRDRRLAPPSLQGKPRKTKPATVLGAKARGHPYFYIFHDDAADRRGPGLGSWRGRNDKPWMLTLSRHRVPDTRHWSGFATAPPLHPGLPSFDSVPPSDRPLANSAPPRAGPRRPAQGRSDTLARFSTVWHVLARFSTIWVHLALCTPRPAPPRPHPRGNSASPHLRVSPPGSQMEPNGAKWSEKRRDFFSNGSHPKTRPGAPGARADGSVPRSCAAAVHFGAVLSPLLAPSCPSVRAAASVWIPPCPPWLRGALSNEPWRDWAAELSPSEFGFRPSFGLRISPRRARKNPPPGPSRSCRNRA